MFDVEKFLLNLEELLCETFRRQVQYFASHGLHLEILFCEEKLETLYSR